MKRLLIVAGLVYVGAAIAGLRKESAGEIECACEPGCWCKQPGLHLFRWVFPFGHRAGPNANGLS